MCLAAAGCATMSFDRACKVVQHSPSFPKALAWLENKGLPCEFMDFGTHSNGWIVAVGTTREFAEGAEHFERLALLYCDCHDHLWLNRDPTLLNDWRNIPAVNWWPPPEDPYASRPGAPTTHKSQIINVSQPFSVSSVPSC